MHHLELVKTAWNTLNKREIRKIEWIQRRATGMVVELKELEYGERVGVN